MKKYISIVPLLIFLSGCYMGKSIRSYESDIVSHFPNWIEFYPIEITFHNFEWAENGNSLIGVTLIDRYDRSSGKLIIWDLDTNEKFFIPTEQEGGQFFKNPDLHPEDSKILYFSDLDFTDTLMGYYNLDTKQTVPIHSSYINKEYFHVLYRAQEFIYDGMYGRALWVPNSDNEIIYNILNVIIKENIESKEYEIITITEIVDLNKYPFFDISPNGKLMFVQDQKNGKIQLLNMLDYSVIWDFQLFSPENSGGLIGWTPDNEWVLVYEYLYQDDPIDSLIYGIRISDGCYTQKLKSSEVLSDIKIEFNSSYSWNEQTNRIAFGGRYDGYSGVFVIDGDSELIQNLINSVDCNITYERD